jgi:hypothetical protein
MARHLHSVPLKPNQFFCLNNMTALSEIRCSETIPHPYRKVCDALALQASQVFHDATTRAGEAADQMAAELHAKIAGIGVNKRVRVEILSYTDMESADEKQLVVELAWEATSVPYWFPTMQARLNVSPVSDEETRLEFVGEYEPPLGLVGQAFDAVVGHQIAESSIRHFVREVAGYLRTRLEHPQADDANQSH